MPDRTAWQVVGVILVSYALLFLPIGLQVGFLRWQPVSNPGVCLGVGLSALVMPGIAEELVFRLLLVPHPTEPMPPLTRRFLIVGSWVLFVLYHVHPWAPLFFRQFPFLLGSGLLGMGCTLAYLQSRSIWTAVFFHWLIVVLWLLLLGGLEKFSTTLP